MIKKMPGWLKVGLFPILLYILWVSPGMMLVHPAGMTSMIGDQNADQDSSHAAWDGPHIFYRGEATIIKQILMKNGQCYPSLDTFFGSIKGKQITCHVNETIKFRTNIRKSLKDEECTYNMPTKLLAISDIEGNFIALRDMLVHNGVMSPEYKFEYSSKGGG